MRDVIVDTTGRSGLIARHRLIEHLSYFLLADPNWTKEYLVPRVLADDEEAITHWRAIARRPRSSDVLELIGHSMTERATDLRIRRETRRAPS
jgi:hypothetical protein